MPINGHRRHDICLQTDRGMLEDRCEPWGLFWFEA